MIIKFFAIIKASGNYFADINIEHHGVVVIDGVVLELVTEESLTTFNILSDLKSILALIFLSGFPWLK